MKKIFYLSAIALVTFTACRKRPDDPVPVKLESFDLVVDAYNGSKLFSPLDTLVSVTGHKFRVKSAKMYFSNINLVKTDGTKVPFKSIVLLSMDGQAVYKTAHNATSVVIKGQVPPGMYSGVEFGLGIPAADNHKDAVAYLPTEPLSQFQKMWWNTNDGYMFAKVEGNISGDLTQPNVLNIDYNYEMGTDAQYKTLFIAQNFQVYQNAMGDINEALLKVQVDQFFYSATDTIKPEINPVAHSNVSAEAPLANKMLQLVQKSISAQ
jgi:hypothetical protein